MLIDIEGNIDGPGAAQEADDLEPGGEFKLPILGFRGLVESVVVDNSPIPEPRSIVGFLKGMTAAIVGRPGVGMSTVPVDVFLKRYPHPPHHPTVWCKDADRDREYRLGAGVCRFCRDRLAVVETLIAHPAVRLVSVAR